MPLRAALPVDESVPELTDEELATLSIPEIKARIRARHYPGEVDRKPIRYERANGSIDLDSHILRVDIRTLYNELRILEKQIKETRVRHKVGKNKQKTFFTAMTDETRAELKIACSRAHQLRTRLIPEAHGTFPPSRMYPERYVAARARKLLKRVGRAEPRPGWDYSDARPKGSQFGKRYSPRPPKPKKLIRLNYPEPIIKFYHLGSEL